MTKTTMGPMRTRVVIAHRDVRVSRALCALVDRRRHEPIVCAPSAAAVGGMLARGEADAYLLELELLSVLAPPEPASEQAPVIALAEDADDGALELAASRGCAGYLLWPCTAPQLNASLALACAREPGSVRSPASSGTHAIALPGGDGSDGDALSAREQEVCDYLRAGHRVSDIAAALFISPHTVRKHAQAVFRKLGVHSQIELMRRYSARRVRTPH